MNLQHEIGARFDEPRLVRFQDVGHHARGVDREDLKPSPPMSLRCPPGRDEGMQAGLRRAARGDLGCGRDHEVMDHGTVAGAGLAMRTHLFGETGGSSTCTDSRYRPRGGDITGTTSKNCAARASLVRRFGALGRRERADLILGE